MTTTHHYLEFEKNIAALEGKLEEFKALARNTPSVSISADIERLESKVEKQLSDLYADLDPWQKTQVARHPVRPHFSDYIHRLVRDFTPLAGDRLFGNDNAIVGGPGYLGPHRAMFIGHEKGNSTDSRIRHNFGMAKPEGYRKAVRLMTMAEQFSLPVIALVDTSGADPGIGAEERGQAEAIAQAISRCLSLGVPNVAVIIGEGGSGGAVALATTNHLIMLEHAIYSVASPEACASILWRETDKTKQAAAALKLTAQDLKSMQIADVVIPEPPGGAHRHPDYVIADVGQALIQALNDLAALSPEEIRRRRHEKFMRIGRPVEEAL